MAETRARERPGELDLVLQVVRRHMLRGVARKPGRHSARQLLLEEDVAQRELDREVRREAVAASRAEPGAVCQLAGTCIRTALLGLRSEGRAERVAREGIDFDATARGSGLVRMRCIHRERHPNVLWAELSASHLQDARLAPIAFFADRHAIRASGQTTFPTPGAEIHVAEADVRTARRDDDAHRRAEGRGA